MPMGRRSVRITASASRPRTGKELWTLHTIPRPGEFGNDTWGNESWKNRTGNNVWAFALTIDEERGLTGASEFPGGVLKAKYFLNLDGEEKGTLCIGCSGGVNTTARRKVGLHTPKQSAAYKIKVSGLKGGHSGVDIHLGRANAIRVLGGMVQRVVEKLGAEVADLKGGSARNVIP